MTAEAGAVANMSLADISGINQPTPLAIPYLLDKLEPAFAKAAK